jgi:hypothetical protein
MKNMKFKQLIHTSLLSGLITVMTAGQANAVPPTDSVAVSVTGELTVLYRDDFKNKRADLQYFIEDKLNNTRYQLQFEGTPPGHLRSGITVKVHGKAKGKEVYLSADGVDSSGDAVAPTTIAVTGEQKTLVMVANFTDTSVSCPIQDINDLMFTDAADQSIDDLYQETSHGDIWLTGQVMGPYNINYASSACDYNAWGQAADTAARASGVEPDNYDRKVYVLPPNGCPAAGIGTVGGNPSSAWIFYCNVADVFGHEFGHNLGMHHAATPSSEYGDNTDIMGIGQNRLRQINAPHKEQMGWLPGIQIAAIDQTGYYDIAPLELDAANALAPQALKISKPDTNEYYYLSYRRSIGFDANLSPSQYLDRLSVHRYPGDGSSSKTHLLALPADGESFVDAINGITVTQLSHNDDYVTVEVSLDGSEPTPTCTTSIPQLNLSPTGQSATAGNTLNYSVQLSNQDSTACAASIFNLNASIPSGWTGSVSPASLSLAPGQSGTATLSVTSPSSAIANSYSLGVNVNDSNEASHAVSGSASYTVVATCTRSIPALGITPASQNGDPGTTRAYSITLANTDTTGCNASTFDLSRILPGWSGSLSPNSLTLSPGESGSATLSVTAPDTAEPGSYTLQVQVSDSQETAHNASNNATYVVNDTTPAADTEAPTAPTGLVASDNFKQVSLSWSPSSDNVAVLGYGVLRDGVLIADVSDTSYTDTGGADGVVYAYSVLAYDAAANLSQESDAVMAGKVKTKAKGGDGGSGGTGGNGGTKGKGRTK